MESRERRPVRPTPGDRGSWSHGPISRVAARPGAPPVEATPEPPAPPAPPAPYPVFVRRSLPGVPPPRSYIARPTRTLTQPPRAGFGLPSLRRNVCPHFYLTGSRGAIPIQAPHLLKSLLRQAHNVSRCQLRGGVHLDEGYVNDVCLTPRFNQCVFYEDELTRS